MREASKHTPGPWEPRTKHLSIWVRDARKREVASCPWHDRSDANYPFKDEALANAALIAAAPDLYEAADEVDVFTSASLNDDRHDDHVVPVLMTLGTIRRFRAALAKVSNGTPQDTSAQPEKST